MAITTTDFSGVFTILAPDATAANNAAGKIVLEQTSSLKYLSLGSTAIGGSLEQNSPIAVMPQFAFGPKIFVGVTKKTGAAWVIGQKLYCATGAVWQTNSTGGQYTGVAMSTQVSADVVGNVLPLVQI